eukprot:5786133-Pyramimonas_sp.AAC.1
MKAWGLQLRLDTGARVTLHRRFAESDLGGSCKRRSAYDIALAYAITGHRAEGSECDSGVVLFEMWCPTAWACTALSRFRRRDAWKIVGQPETGHFLPRRSR